MRKFTQHTPVIMVVGFTIGYYIGRNYDLTLAVKKVK